MELERPVEEWQKVREKLPAAKLRRWILDQSIDETRRNTYARLLGVAGGRTDCPRLLLTILDAEGDFVHEISGMTEAYVRLTDDHGLEKLVAATLLRAEEPGLGKADVPFYKKYALLNAVRAVKECPPTCANRVSDRAVRDASNLLLAEPTLLDLVVPDLIRWKDWSQISNLHGKLLPEDSAMAANEKAVNAAIVRYILVIARSPKNAAPTRATAKAGWFLKRIEKTHPKTLKRVRQVLVY